MNEESLFLWIMMFICELLIPIIMIIIGVVFVKNPPKEINGIYGYRTKMSRLNQDTWDFAHHYCGKLWFKIGCIMLPVSILAMIILFGKSENVIGIATTVIQTTQVVVLIVAIFPVEKALKENFDKYGNRKK